MVAGWTPTGLDDPVELRSFVGELKAAWSNRRGIDCGSLVRAFYVFGRDHDRDVGFDGGYL